MAAGGFVKFDAGKARYDLIDPRVLASLARVLTAGAAKYSDDNWKKAFRGRGGRPGGTGRRRYSAALMRHFEAWRMGEGGEGWQDEETGEPHLVHAMCCLMFLAAATTPWEQVGRPAAGARPAATPRRVKRPRRRRSDARS